MLSIRVASGRAKKKIISISEQSTVCNIRGDVVFWNSGFCGEYRRLRINQLWLKSGNHGFLCHLTL